MNKIENIEQFVAVLTSNLVSLNKIGSVPLPCPAPQPWNDARYVLRFSAPKVGARRPDWQYNTAPTYTRVDGDMATNRFAGIRISVNIADATMYGSSKNVTVSTPEEIDSAIATLEEYRNEQLNRCRHYNHRFIANLGRCYNRYECNDCGVKFEIDSGD